MKRTVAVVILFLVAGLLATAEARPRREGADDGRLLIRFSPTVGMDAGMVIRIDGRTAGALSRGHVFDQFIAAGRHQLTVRRNGRGFGQYSAPLHVQPGQTYSFVVKLPHDQVVLQPSGLPR